MHVWSPPTETYALACRIYKEKASESREPKMEWVFVEFDCLLHTAHTGQYKVHPTVYSIPPLGGGSGMGRISSAGWRGVEERKNEVRTRDLSFFLFSIDSTNYRTRSSALKGHIWGTNREAKISKGCQHFSPPFRKCFQLE